MTKPTPRTVLVTGANRGIGLAIATALAAAGHRVAATYRSSPIAADGVFPVRCDVTDPTSVDEAFSAVEEHFGPVEVLVANAGVTADTLIMRMSEEQWANVIDTNLTGSWRLAKRASRNMIRNRFGRLIFIGSASGTAGVPGQTNYTASKSGLIGLSRSLARELGTRNITANVVAPGFTDTDMAASIGQDNLSEMQELIPLKRLGQPAEIASAVEWLASDGGAYVNGAVIRVDGGIGMGY
jgi:beta-ketoacyl ACP reductase